MTDWKNKLDPIQNKFKFQLHSKKQDDLETVYAQIQKFDPQGDGWLSKDDFIAFLSKLGIFYTTQEQRAIFDQYDQEKNGRVWYGDFIQYIRTTMSEKRLAVVKHAYQFLVKPGEQSLDLEFLLGFYKSENHPRVRTNQKNKTQIFNEFKDAIMKRTLDGKTVSETEFLEYYADINATLPYEKEEYFVDIVLSAWGLSSSPDYVSADRISQLESILYEKIRQKTQTLEDEGKTVKKAFKYFDLNDCGFVTFAQFKSALDKFGCVFTDKEIKALFSKHDLNKNQKLCYDEFANIFALKGSGRYMNVNPVFELYRQPPMQLIQRLKAYLLKKGVLSQRKLVINFQKADKFNLKYLNRQEFVWVMKQSEFDLTKTEYDNLFSYFDKNHDDKISYEEFVSVLRSDPKWESRVKIIRDIYASFDTQKNDAVQVSTLDQALRTIALKNFTQDKRPIEDIYKEFIQLWRLAVNGAVNCAGFEEFHCDLSACVQDCKSFQKFVLELWGLQ